MQNYILYVAYGNIDNINECKYALLKYFDKYLTDEINNISIVIYTDQPHFFEPYALFYNGIIIKKFSVTQIKEWRGEDDFGFRTKIKIIQDFFSTYSGNLLYCDTDTYVTQPLQIIFSAIETGSFYMHEYEGILGDRSNSYFRKWDKFLSKNLIEYNGKNLMYSNQIQMWNAGVIGLNGNNNDLLEDVLSLTDNIYKKFKKHIAEQFAFGYCIQQKGKINAAEKNILHYWDLKEFRIVLKEFFDNNKNDSITELIKKVNSFNVVSLVQEKELFKKRNWLKKLIQGKTFDINQYITTE